MSGHRPAPHDPSDSVTSDEEDRLVPYVVCTHSPGRSMADYRVVNEALGDESPAGLRASIAGTTDGTLHTVDVWDSKAHADRFAAERLYPAMQQAGVGPGADSTYIGFDTDVVSLDGTLP